MFSSSAPNAIGSSAFMLSNTWITEAIWARRGGELWAGATEAECPGSHMPPELRPECERCPSSDKTSVPMGYRRSGLHSR